MVSINAPIRPAKACAGFYIGQHISEILSEINHLGARIWRRSEGEQLAASIKRTPGWLRVPVEEISIGQFGGEIWHFSHGMTELHFDQFGILFEIAVFDGYKGLLRNSIGIGTPMAELNRFCTLSNDNADGIYIPQGGDGLDGVAFYSDENEASPLVSGISVFNFELTEGNQRA